MLIRPVSQTTSIPPLQGSSTQFEFNEVTAVTLEWRVSGLKAMYDGTKGETKSSVCLRVIIIFTTDKADHQEMHQICRIRGCGLELGGIVLPKLRYGRR